MYTHIYAHVWALQPAVLQGNFSMEFICYSNINGAADRVGRDPLCAKDMHKYYRPAVGAMIEELFTVYIEQTLIGYGTLHML